jgi:aspartate carbamoyltransferase regulatory subunit
MARSEKELRVGKIRAGTVIDHITPGRAFAVLKILGITGEEGDVVSALMNVPSKKHGKKDVIKVENRELTEKEVNKIALAAPNATISIIKNFRVSEKRRVQLPGVIHGIIKCSNPGCITNLEESIVPKFKVVDQHPLTLRCHYCERVTTEKEVIAQL